MRVRAPRSAKKEVSYDQRYHPADQVLRPNVSATKRHRTSSISTPRAKRVATTTIREPSTKRLRTRQNLSSPVYSQKWHPMDEAVDEAEIDNVDEPETDANQEEDEESDEDEFDAGSNEDYPNSDLDAKEVENQDQQSISDASTDVQRFERPRAVSVVVPSSSPSEGRTRTRVRPANLDHDPSISESPGSQSRSRNSTGETRDLLPSLESGTESSSDQTDQSSPHCSILLRSDGFDEDYFFQSADHADEEDDAINEDGDECGSKEQLAKGAHANQTFDVGTQTTHASDPSENLNSIFNRAPALVYVKNNNNRRCLRFNDLKHFDQTLYNLQHGLSAETHMLPRTWDAVSKKLQEHGYLSSDEAESPDVTQWLISRYERLVDGVDSFCSAKSNRERIWVRRGPPSSATLPQMEVEDESNLDGVEHSSKHSAWKTRGECEDSQPSIEPPQTPSLSPERTESIFGPRAATTRLTEDITEETFDDLQDHLFEQMQTNDASQSLSLPSKYPDGKIMEDSELTELMDRVNPQIDCTPLRSPSSALLSGSTHGLSTPETPATDDTSTLFTSPPALPSPISPTLLSPTLIASSLKGHRKVQTYSKRRKRATGVHTIFTIYEDPDCRITADTQCPAIGDENTPAMANEQRALRAR